MHIIREKKVGKTERYREIFLPRCNLPIKSATDLLNCKALIRSAGHNINKEANALAFLAERKSVSSPHFLPIEIKAYLSR